MARFFPFFRLFHLSLTFFRPEVPFNCSNSDLDERPKGKISAQFNIWQGNTMERHHPHGQVIHTQIL